MTQDDSKYTDPELRVEIKEKVHEGDKGGNAGQWSARKAQMVASQYKQAMKERGEEPYTTDKSEQNGTQKNLSNWGDEEWQTSDGSAYAKQEDGTQKRYLPKKAWEKMSEEEKEETNEAKLNGGRNGHQHVANTEAAKEARKTSQEAESEVSTNKKQGTKHKLDEDEDEDDEDDDDDADGEYVESSTDASENEGAKGGEPAPKKRKANNGKNKTKGKGGKASGDNGKEEASKGDHGRPGSADRLPEKGQKVHWRASPGWCEGTVVEIIREEKLVANITAKASYNDPRIVLKSAKSGKEAVHKPEAVYF